MNVNIILKKRHIKGLVISSFLGAIMLLSFLGLEDFWTLSDDKGAEAVHEAILRATVQCYALEGAYPKDVVYLEDNYGIQLNERAYYYYYEYLGANIRPNIEVVRKWSD